jgi:hypothetical protein
MTDLLPADNIPCAREVKKYVKFLFPTIFEAVNKLRRLAGTGCRNGSGYFI